jgi:queuine/archaeosine tRNA-ribosyltransferase
MVVRVKVLTDFLGICSEEVLQAVAAGVDLFDSTYPSIL